ncbi:Transmembrane protein [Armadillidium vulgare]|nr:Transmembrane protein [Armadillidium vulgare]
MNLEIFHFGINEAVVEKTGSTTSTTTTTTQTATQTSPEGLTFNIGTPLKEETLRLSPKNSRKERGSKPLRSKRDRPVSPGTLQGNKHGLTQEKAKEAMSPSVAECLRAVFAAFLWHEGIVHDAMACASYLKFHPDLTKQGTLLWKLCLAKPKQQQKQEPPKLTKEQKARQRHSVEVSTYSYLNVVVQNTDEFSKPSPTNANIIEEGNKGNIEEARLKDSVSSNYSSSQTSSQGYKLATVMEGGAPGGSEAPQELPLVLRHVVLLWEELTSSCLKAIAQQVILPSPTAPSRSKKPEKGKEKEKKRSKKKPSGPSKQSSSDGAVDEVEDELGGQCELCGQMVPHHASEQHFTTTHPGCGWASHGCGYVGTRWKFFPSKDRLPLPCGEVFRGCYHMCWSCRNKLKGQSSQLNVGREISSRKNKRKAGIRMLSPMPNIDTHVVMRNNSMFLLDLASAASSNILTRSHVPRKSPCPMPCVSELSPDASPFPKVAFQCLHTLNCQQQHLNQLKEDLLLTQHHALHNSDTTTNTTTTGNSHYSSSGDSKENQKEGVLNKESPASDPEISWRPFHRSISVTVGPSGQDWSSAAIAAAAAAGQQDNPPRSGVVLRKRNNSSSENSGSGVSSLLAHPSIALEKLAAQMSRVGGPNDPSGRARQVIIRPIMAFIFQNHDLETLAYAMRHATRKAAARVYAMQALNWLLQSVTQPTCLHDLLWCFVMALSPPSHGSSLQSAGAGDNQLSVEDENSLVLEHPLSDVTLSGDAIHPLPQTFHQLLQTIADLMMLLPPGSPLQMMAVRCWGLKFSPADHDFLHQSHVFSNISKILSRSEEVLGAGEEAAVSSVSESSEPTSGQVEMMVDLTQNCDVKTSSRQAMVSSLTDSSTETFWESGDEDRNKTKIITVTCPTHLKPRALYIHNKVSSVVFKCGSCAEDIAIIHQLDVETRYAGWVHTYLTEKQVTSSVYAELRGPDQSVRVRQIRVMGFDPSGGERGVVTQRGFKHCSPITLQHRMCEQETLRVFRLITSQVFGRLLMKKEQQHDQEQQPQQQQQQNLPEEGEEEGAPQSPIEAVLEDADHNNDLREHMVGILFSRSKLNHLQKQVCSHIVQAIKKEAKRARDEWEADLLNGAALQAVTPATPEEGHQTLPDTYCFEMLSMVLALSGSPVGRAHLAHQESLLKHLLSLLHTGSARVQRQVVSLFRRMLLDITPMTLAQVLGIFDLPPMDLTVVQIKNKGNEGTTVNKVSSPEGGSKPGVTSVTLADVMPKPQSNSCRWYLQGGATRKLADLIISLIRDMTYGRLTDEWAKVSKGAIAENIINLTRLHERNRSTAASCLATPTLWLALASLCVLHPEHIEALSSQQWRTAAGADSSQQHLRPMCENHDDDSTGAMILCDSCGNLCGECDRILHLHRRTRTHHRTVFREEQQAIKVDLHEGCGRTKLFWLLALADATTLKAMMELRSESNRTRDAGPGVSSCRFCGSPAQTSLLSPIPVCQDTDCQEYSREACTRTLDCSHVCGGIKGEMNCLPCLLGCSADATLKQDADDMCMICFSEALSAAPCLQLDCGHVFHYHCCKSVLSKRWPGPRITFGFSMCPICKVSMKHWSLTELLQPILALYEDVRRKALMRLEYEGLLKAEAVSSPGARYHNDPASYAMDRYAYYVCFKCTKAYYGGEARCENDLGLSDDYDPRELVCGACSDVSRAQMCPKHGTDFLEYKCRYCCSVAVFFCFGTTHFCNACHEDFQRVTNIPKQDLPHCPAGPRAQQMTGEECPLHVQHPPTGEEFALGCGVK